MHRLVLVAVLSGGCVLPYAIPPLRGEFGAATSHGEPAMHVGGGTHLASGTTSRDQPFDIGVGGFVDSSETTLTTAAYADAAIFIERSHRTRTSLGARGELRWNDGRGMGAKLRIDHEVFTATKKGYSGSDRCGFIAGAAHGIAGAGFYAEAGRVWEPNNQHAWVAGAGLSLRLPSTLGLIVGIPGCK